MFREMHIRMLVRTNDGRLYISHAKFDSGTEATEYAQRELVAQGETVLGSIITDAADNVIAGEWMRA